MAGALSVHPAAVVGERCRFDHALADVTIGAGARLDTGVALLTTSPGDDDPEVPIRLQPPRAAPIVVGAGARLGVEAVVLGGVTIGEGAVVRPHAVVTRDVPPGATVDGVPARVVA